QSEESNVERAGGGYRASSEEQRVTRKEWRHDETGFREDHDEQDRVDPRAVRGDQLQEVGVEMENCVEQLGHDTCSSACARSACRSSTSSRPTEIRIMSS